MNREIIGNVTDWDSGQDADWACAMAQNFLAVALGSPPDGLNVKVAQQEHNSRFRPVLAIDWSDCVSKPVDYISHAMEALAEFKDAIDWHRIRPSRFRSSERYQSFQTADAYLDHLADTLCVALQNYDVDERADWMAIMRQRAEELGIHWILGFRATQDEEIRAILSPDNMNSNEWASACLEAGTARAADPDEPDSVIGRLYWPTLPGLRVRDD